MEENTMTSHDPDAPHEDITVELESDSLQSTLLARRSLVGRILSRKLLNRGVVKSILAKAWDEYGDFQITDMGTNMFLFSFTKQKEVMQILPKGPWYVMGHLLSLQFWVPEATLYEVNFDRVSFWTQFHGLPLDVMNTSHRQKSCRSDKAMSSFDQTTPKYNAKLGVPPAKPILQIVQEHGLKRQNRNKMQAGMHEGKSTEGQGKKVTHMPLPRESNMITNQINFAEVQPTSMGLEQEKRLLLGDIGPNGPTPTSATGIDIPHQESAKGKSKMESNDMNEENQLPYIVEFPEDEDQGNSIVPIQQTIQLEEESQLIVGWNKSLSLKRQREVPEIQKEENQDTETNDADQKKRRIFKMEDRS
ncbi:hypothetical protein SESBI_13245 [Sesbania bispinosa]|nr:hypothetical protein SESBI_13245 [Sesbania bispinosa]